MLQGITRANWDAVRSLCIKNFNNAIFLYKIRHTYKVHYMKKLIYDVLCYFMHFFLFTHQKNFNSSDFLRFLILFKTLHSSFANAMITRNIVLCFKKSGLHWVTITKLIHRTSGEQHFTTPLFLILNKNSWTKWFNWIYQLRTFDELRLQFL